MKYQSLTKNLETLSLIGIFLLTLLLIILIWNDVNVKNNTDFIDDDYNNYVYNLSYEIEYDGLNENEIIFVNKLIGRTKPMYLTRTNKFIFTKNNTYILDAWGKNNKDNVSILGLNFENDRTIYVLMRDEKQTVRTFQHEVLHNFVNIKEDPKNVLEEKIVDDMEDINIIYEKIE